MKAATMKQRGPQVNYPTMNVSIGPDFRREWKRARWGYEQQ